jgi:hypothetical protein
VQDRHWHTSDRSVQLALSDVLYGNKLTQPQFTVIRTPHDKAV